MVSGLRFRVQDFWVWAWALGFRIFGFGPGFWGLGLGVRGLEGSRFGGPSRCGFRLGAVCLVVSESQGSMCGALKGQNPQRPEVRDPSTHALNPKL